ncbi:MULTISPECIES: sporulation peptidase YabG [Allobacillus]|uniref:Sporulation peptidase YabG n=1 Tax=Allobacillus halotolerans TaxID=570278 RepID=A0ABS6GLW2_9BACI|nr:MULTISPECIES: sporulation peptidase YabG [Allobacillus]MBU6080119.1 sporulation peptidase YabG [Allobacillus halotolerans]TSJ65429.1 sporulation peptidase YabG [Allobacillus sp. SKP2-8]
MNLQRGDIVTRYSYDHDLLFRVQSIDQDQVQLYGENFRLEVDAPIDDLKIVIQEEKKRVEQSIIHKEHESYRLFRQDYYLRSFRDHSQPISVKDAPRFQICPKVLHMDSDALFLKKCVLLYKKLGLQVHGAHVKESEMPHQVAELLEKVQPDILVLTGHDSYSKQKGEEVDLRAYRNSRYFVEAVRAARKKVSHLDQLVIFAGACQSHFESLIRAGANFASSPTRINIHALDPVYVAAKVGYTPFMEKVDIYDVIEKTVTQEKGIGGLETRGLFRTGLPYMKKLPKTHEKANTDE